MFGTHIALGLGMSNATTKGDAMHTQINLDRFHEELTKHYTDLFAADPEYAYSASRTTPAELARKMTLGLDNGTADKDGEGVRRTCKALGINHTYKAIRAFLTAQ